METLQAERLSFGQENFGTAQLGDRRRTRRLVETADRMVQHPGGTLPDKLPSPTALKGLYRLVESQAVSHAAVLQPHRELTLQRMRGHEGVVLTIHDTTELDYTGKKSLQAIGQIGNGTHRGYLCHNTLAVDAESREVIGLANQILFCRPEVPDDEPRQARRERATRESRLWKQGSHAVGSAPPGKRWVDVCDRGADLFEYLDDKHLHHESYVVRSRHNRWILMERAGQHVRCKLHDAARELPELGRKEVSVPARGGQLGRTVQVRVAAGAVSLIPPRQKRGEHRDEPISTWVVHVHEIDPPVGVEPVEWILLTNVPMESFEDSCRRTDWYSCRWIVEEFHKAQKTGCGIELLQFTKEDRLDPVIALLSVVALSLLQLRSASRRPDAAVRPATDVVPAMHVAVLSGWRFGTVRTDLTLHEFFYALARLGGHQNRKHDRPPGWLVLWRGWMKLQSMLEGAAAIGFTRCG